MTVLLTITSGLLIGLSLGALGGGGSILAVPVLVYLLGQTAVAATTGSLVVVAVTSLLSAVIAHRAGHVMLGRGLAFGVTSIAGAAVGAAASLRVPDAALLAAFAGLMLVVAALMLYRQVRLQRPESEPLGFADPILTFKPAFLCNCPRALRVLVAATAVGVLTGFLGVGGGFLVVPALMLALGLPITYAVGTSLIVIAVTSAVALAIRTGSGVSPDWPLVLTLTAASVIGGGLGARLGPRVNATVLSASFTVLVLGVAVYTTARVISPIV
ncbi:MULTISPECIES: sulfite exporter TauE/SafE family protein [unclassified Kribbella]|uniref:sulfite exporter TauE/SafE family protein n=1 Tax=unclassified Kribbella TaxID=2644121 RepID=UPI003019405B